MDVGSIGMSFKIDSISSTVRARSSSAALDLRVDPGLVHLRPGGKRDQTDPAEVGPERLHR